MRIRRGKVPGIRVKAVHFPGGAREDGRMGGEMAVSAEDLSSAVFEKSLITKRMQNGAEDRGGGFRTF